MVWTDKAIADSLGDWKAQKIKDSELGFFASILNALRIKKLDKSLKCELRECVLTRGKHPSSMGLRAWFNQIKPGKRDSSEFDTRVYEIVQQWRTDKEFTVSAIIWKKKGSITPQHDQLREGIAIEIAEYGCVWHLLHRWAMMLNSLLTCFKLLDAGSSVEVYPEKWEMIP